MEHRCHLGKEGTQCGQDLFLQAGFEGFTADKLARDLIDLLERKIKKCNSHREREVLRYAQHLLQCNGCEKNRIHKNTGCINCREKKSRKWKRKSCSPAHFHCNRYFAEPWILYRNLSRIQVTADYFHEFRVLSSRSAISVNFSMEIKIVSIRVSGQ